MAEEKNKKPVGRPKKKEVVLDNEGKEIITMTKKEIKKSTVQQGVGTLQDAPEKITMDDIRARWAQVFRKFGGLGIESISTAWGNNKFMQNNPFIQNQRIKQINSPAIKLTKEELSEAMGEPEAHEDSLRSVSWGLYYSNYIYQTLLQLNKNTPKYLCYASPLYVDKVSKEDIRSDSVKVDKVLKKFNPQLTFKTIATQVAIEGKCSYLVRTSYNTKDVDFLLLQKLNSNQVKITGLGSKQHFVASFNMVIFLEPGYSVEQYPKFIQDAWADMVNTGIIVEDKRGKKKLNPRATLPYGHVLESLDSGKYMYWVQIPQDLCYTFYSDGAHPNAFPDAVGLFTDLNELGDYRWLQGSLLSKGVNSVLTAEVPLVKDPKVGGDSTAISPDTILGYQDFFAENISANIFPFFAPFNDYELHSLENQPDSMNIIYSRLRDLIASSGNSALLSLSEKPTVASTLAAEKLQASKNDYLTRQFQQFLNNVINNNFNLKCEWNISLHGNIFTSEDEEKTTKELVKSGARGLIPKLLSFEGLSVEDYKGAVAYLDALGIEIKTNNEILSEEKLDTENNAENKSSILLPENDENEDDETAKIGRPAKEGNEIINDNTDISKSAGNNVSLLK